MKLFLITVERSFMVAADSETEAELEAEWAEGEEIGNGVEATFLHAVEITNANDIPTEWLDSIPYGGEGDTVCREIIETSDRITPVYNTNQLKLV